TTTYVVLAHLTFVAPIVIVLADVAHLYLESLIIARVVSQHSPFKGLNQYIFVDAPNFHVCPVSVADWVSTCVEPWVVQLSCYLLPILHHKTLLVQERPKYIWDVVP